MDIPATARALAGGHEVSGGDCDWYIEEACNCRLSEREAAIESALRAAQADALREEAEKMPERVKLHLSCLPANLREVIRGLENGMFGGPVPLGTRGERAQQWVNAAMAFVNVENAIEAAEYLQGLRDRASRLATQEQ